MKCSTFAAHDKVNCLRIGPRSGRVLVTGGEDRKVNLWAFGKSSALLSLSGMTSPITSVTMDFPEELVVAGSSSGMVKLWDLEHSKVRTLSGHKSDITALEFHPFGEFFASASSDMSARIWDIRKKGCIQTYLGHSFIHCLQITPDGRWIATGGDCIKIWDMTAGKILSTIPQPTSSLAFNPAEFILAASSSSETFIYDLSNFSLLSSTPSDDAFITFHPDGRDLIISQKSRLDITEWDPFHLIHSIPSVKMADIKIVDGPSPTLLSCSIDDNMVQVWGIPYKQDEETTPIIQDFITKTVISDPPPEPIVPKLPVIEPKKPIQPIQPIQPVQAQPAPVERVQPIKPVQPAPVERVQPMERPIEPKPTKSAYIPASDGKVLNLDISKFLDKNSPPMPLSTNHPTNDEELLEAIGFRHASVLNILNNRLRGLRSVRDVWNESNIKASIESLVKIPNPSLWVDVLRILNLKPKLITLPVACTLLPLLNELVFDIYEDYIITACTTARLLCQQFSDLILTTLSANIQGVDFAMESRMEKCQECQLNFLNMYEILTEMPTSGRLGSVIRDTLQELSIMKA